MHTVEFPLAFGHWQIRRDALTCRLPRKTVDVAAPSPLLQAVLELCNGRLAWREVAAALATHWMEDSVERFLADLCRQGLLVEAGESLAHWRSLGEVPTGLPRLASDQEVRDLPSFAHARLLPGAGGGTSMAQPRTRALADLLKLRASHRTFADVPISREDLASITWAAHGVARAADEDSHGGVVWHRTTASGGNLHAARWLVAVLRDLPGHAPHGAGTPAGLYEAAFHAGGGVSFVRLPGDVRTVWTCLLDPRPLRFASAVLLPVWDLATVTRKYGNRATVLATFEAGQCLQNAQLMVAALGAAAGVRGDTCADAVLGLFTGALGEATPQSARWLSLPGLVVGAMPSHTQIELQRSSRWIRVGPVSTGAASTGADTRFAYHAGPVPIGDAQVFTSGRSADPARAVTKAEAESWERLGWARMAQAEAARWSEVEGALDPREVVAYTEAQYRRPQFPCTPFSRRRDYLWVAGNDAETGASVRLPAECVHAQACLPPPYRGRLYTGSTTSGVAAWSDSAGALDRALLELVERDAFLRCWISGQAPLRIRPTGLPRAVVQRLQTLSELGFDATVCQVPSAFAPVVCVHVRRHRPCFAAVTAAADFDLDTALDRALCEAEGRAAHARQFPAHPLQRLDQVESPEGINSLYQSARNFRRADFLAQGPERPALELLAPLAPGSGQLRRRLQAAGHRVLAFDLTPPGASVDQGRTPLRVVRAFATGLLPIWFHHALAPAGMPGFRSARKHRRTTTAGSGVFIHPFT